MNDIPRTNPELIKELSRDAKTLMDNKAFMAAVNVLMKQWQAQMLAESNRDKVMDYKAQMVALQAIPAMLDSIMHGTAFMEKGSNGGRR